MEELETTSCQSYVFNENEFRKQLLRSWDIAKKKLLASQAYALHYNLQSLAPNSKIVKLVKLSQRRFERRCANYEKLTGIWNFRHDDIMSLVAEYKKYEGVCDQPIPD